VTKPPGHTCPNIDMVQRAIRRLRWRLRNGSQDGAEEIAKQALADLEMVRDENAQMRKAYYAMKAVLKERGDA
jgi:hypothetical protein